MHCTLNFDYAMKRLDKIVGLVQEKYVTLAVIIVLATELKCLKSTYDMQFHLSK